MYYPSLIPIIELDTISPVEPVQDQPDDKTAHHGDDQDPPPVKMGDAGMQVRHIIRAIEPRLQRFDPEAERDGRAARKDAHDQGDKPELHLRWPARPNKGPAVAAGGAHILKALPNQRLVRLAHP